MSCSEPDVPKPESVQVVNPLMEVDSVAEMEKYLDFLIPVLEKEAETYFVLVFDGYPQIGRIRYTDGTVFNVKYGNGDISGIYGGVSEKEEQIEGVTVSFLNYGDIRYAIWEKEGFTYSLTGGEKLEEESRELLK